MIRLEVRSSRGNYAVSETPHAALLEGVAAVVTDENVLPLLPATERPMLVLPAGERTKRLGFLERTLEFFAETGVLRADRVAICGGGVIGDLGGFAAATYMRGIPYVHVPTTLLAMVDSSVGGKVGVDLAAGKNLAGAFHPPAEVRLYLPFLETLPPREIAAGLAEAIKTGAILDATLFDLLDDRPRTIGRCIALKAQIVAEDEDERRGRRAILNFGHTVAHAIEAATGYARYLHGEAVAIGMVAEARLGERLGLTEAGVADRIRRSCAACDLPTEIPRDVPPNILVEAMRRDKKATSGCLAFALVEKLGTARLVPDVPEADVRAIIATG